MSGKVLLEAKGINGQLVVYENKVLLQRKGMLAIGMYDKEILIKSISSIQMKKPGLLMNGFIQFAFSGGKESKGGLRDATKDENSIVLRMSQEKQFLEAKNLIEELMSSTSAYTVTPVVQQHSDLDELEKLAGLKEKGIITEEEFTLKKKQLLGI